MERIVLAELQDYLTDNNIRPAHQFAYRKNHSTEDALVLATEYLLEAKDNRQTSAGALLDLSKAFDKVKHDVLISDLHRIRIVGVPLLWFRSYLPDRRQRVVVGMDRSSITHVSCGVPQGSVLGPTLFALYVKHLTCTVRQLVRTLQFADDILLMCSHEDASKVAQDLNTSVTSLATWLEHRGLILNERKSQVLTFAPRINPGARVTVLCRGTPLPSVPSAKYLGLTMDSNLSWLPHIQCKCLEVSRSIGALRRARNSQSLAARIKFYSSVILSNLFYSSNAFVSNMSSYCADKVAKL